MKQLCFHEGVMAPVKFEARCCAYRGNAGIDSFKPIDQDYLETISSHLVSRATPCAGGGDEVSGIVGTYE